MRTLLERIVAAGALLAVAFAAQAGVAAKDAWVRGTAPGQQTAAAYVTLTSTEDAKVVEVASPAAGRSEVHASMMMSGVAHMHAVEALELPARRPVELKPGGHHVMLMQLARPLKAGDHVPLVFTIEDSKGRRSKLEVDAVVRPLVP